MTEADKELHMDDNQDATNYLEKFRHPNKSPVISSAEKSSSFHPESALSSQTGSTNLGSLASSTMRPVKVGRPFPFLFVSFLAQNEYRKRKKHCLLLLLLLPIPLLNPQLPSILPPLIQIHNLSAILLRLLQTTFLLSERQITILPLLPQRMFNSSARSMATPSILPLLPQRMFNSTALSMVTPSILPLLPQQIFLSARPIPQQIISQVLSCRNPFGCKMIPILIFLMD